MLIELYYKCEVLYSLILKVSDLWKNFLRKKMLGVGSLKPLLN